MRSLVSSHEHLNVDDGSVPNGILKCHHLCIWLWDVSTHWIKERSGGIDNSLKQWAHHLSWQHSSDLGRQCWHTPEAHWHQGSAMALKSTPSLEEWPAQIHPQRVGKCFEGVSWPQTGCLGGTVSQIWILTSKITQVCQDICDIKLRRLLVTQSDKEPNDIANHILTNWNDRKDTLGLNKSRSGTLGTHGGHAEDGTDYVYNTPNHHEHGNWDTQQHHGTYQPLWPQEPSEMPPMPLPYPDPSEASERSSSLPASLSSPPKKDDTKPAALLMNTERPNASWNLCLAPANKYSRAEPEEELEMREGTGLRRGAASPDQEFGRGIGIGVVPPTCLDLEDKQPLLAIASAFWQEGQVVLWRSTRMAWAGIQCSIME